MSSLRPLAAVAAIAAAPREGPQGLKAFPAMASPDSVLCSHPASQRAAADRQPRVTVGRALAEHRRSGSCCSASELLACGLTPDELDELDELAAALAVKGAAAAAAACVQAPVS